MIHVQNVLMKKNLCGVQFFPTFYSNRRVESNFFLNDACDG